MLKACYRKVVGGLNLNPTTAARSAAPADRCRQHARICATKTARQPHGWRAEGAQLPEQELGSEKNAGRAMEHAHVEDVLSDSISIARCRELLDGEAEGLSDHEVDLIRQHVTAMAHVIVEMFLERSATPE
jgi:hypothetical protein